MKVNINKINKYQAGGYMVYQPLPLAPPVAQSASSSSTETATAETEASTLDDKMVEKLVGQGLTNDVMQFSNGLNSAYKQYENMTDTEKNSVYGRQLRSMMKGDIGQVNAIRRHKEMFTKSIASVEQNDALGETAVTKNGFLVKNEETGKILEVGFAEYAKQHRDNPKMRVLTNADLIEEREYNPNLVMNESAYAILGNSVGMSKVKEEITKILTNLGSEKKTTETSAYLYNSDNLPADVKAAAQQLVGMGPEGFYKVNTTRSQETNERLLVAASDAMWANLSPNAKSLLRAKASVEGASPDEIEKVAKSYAVSLINVGYKNDVTEKTDVTFDDKMTENQGGSGGGSGKSDSLTGDVDFWTLLATDGGDKQPVQVDYGDGNVTTAYGFSPGVFLSGGKPTGQTSIRNIPELNSIIDPNSASIGGVKIPRNKLEAIIYEGNEVTRVKMPAKKDRSGALVPDFDKAKQYNELIEKLKDIPTASAKEQLIQQSGFISDGRGNINPQMEADFIVFDGMVNENALGGVSDKRLLKAVESNEQEIYEGLYRNNDRAGDDSKAMAGTGEDYGWLTGWITSNDVYRGRVFIAMRSNMPAIAGRMADGKSLAVPKSQNTPIFLGTERKQTNNGVNPKYGF